MTATSPILQFGTSRFLQAHADLFISDALERGEAIGTVAVVQTTGSPERAGRVAAMASGSGYPVRIRGLVGGVPIDEWKHVRSVRRGLHADRDWLEVCRLAVEEAVVILSNTGDRGFEPDPLDDARCIQNRSLVPRGFPAKLVVLLHARWQARPEAPISIFPCELISRNGEILQTLVTELAQSWNLPAAFLVYLRSCCRWANSLVDRIVSEPLSPVGAVAEPYALWAIERQAELVLPCMHEAIVVTDDLARFERLKLHLLNLGHTMLAETWLRSGGSPELTVSEAMNDPSMRAGLEAVWNEEVLPVFMADGLGEDARAYLAELRDRFGNPFLFHRLADIAQDHDEKKRRRLLPVVAAAERLGLPIAQDRLRLALGGQGAA